MPAWVYVVDDEKVIANTLAAILRNGGFDAKPFFSPMAVMEAAESAAPDVLISDVVMPEMGGVELAIQIKNRHPNCRVLLFSGQASTSDILEQARNDGHDFQLLSKPIHPKDLLAVLAGPSKNV